MMATMSARKSVRSLSTGSQSKEATKAEKKSKNRISTGGLFFRALVELHWD